MCKRGEGEALAKRAQSNFLNAPMDEHIVRLQIVVQNRGTMQVTESCGELDRQLNCLFVYIVVELGGCVAAF